MWIKQPPAQVADKVWMLGTYEYPLYLAGAGTERVLFEGGTGPMGALVCEQLEELGIPLQSIRRLVIPHAHPDHVMAVPVLRGRIAGLKVLASPAAAATLGAEKAVAFFCKIDEAITAGLIHHRQVAERHRPLPLVEPRIAVDEHLAEGDRLAADGLGFAVLETPGHSDCSLSFHEPQRGILLVSDAVGYYMHGHDYWWPDYFADYAAYLHSIRRLAALGAETLCLGHHGVIQGRDDVRAFLEAALEATAQYHQRIVALARQRRTAREIAEQLGSEVFEKTPGWLPLDFFQKNCNLLVKQSLKHEGISPEG